MRILTIADEESKALWDHFRPGTLKGVDLILSCGDLDPDYLQFLVTMANCPLLYVRGNHDEVYDRRPPLGCTSVEDRIYRCNGLRILGLGGSMRYREGGVMYSEREMRARIRKLWLQLRIYGGFDILLTHAPARGIGDREDLPHQGFECFNTLMEKWKPAYMIHGHIHRQYGGFHRIIEHPCGTKVINACERYAFEL
ncbi:MAG: metallophosphoesterase [Lachnospiraceae bacterium]|nr:metallophosphoesterase [Lachnospiraceae bacterium]